MRHTSSSFKHKFQWTIKYPLFLFFIFLSCKDLKRDAAYTPHPKLLNWTSEFLTEDGDELTRFYQEHESFVNAHFSEMQLSDSLIVTTVLEINCCGRTVGNIDIVNDTIFLFSENLSYEICTCTELRKFTFAIENSDRKEFQFKSEE